MPARQLESVLDRPTVVFASEERGPGNAPIEYIIADKKLAGSVINTDESFGFIKFQNGVIPENGVNGATNEDLLEILIDRLTGFQTGEYPCGENMMAIRALKTAMMFLDRRTLRRRRSNIEGKMEESGQVIATPDKKIIKP